MIGKTLSHYEILEKLGAGGMGEVYRGRDTKLGRDVAIKVLSPEFSADPERRKRFAREAQAIAALKHPNIVTIYSVEEIDDVSFITMELVEGDTLSQAIPPAGLDLQRFFDNAIALSDAVSAAHEEGITHRDLKPANIMFDKGGRLKVLDFGLAKLLHEEADPTSAQTVAQGSDTVIGQVLGTAAYMSPEQAEGKPIDHRSDIFSLGIVLYEMATGQRPFHGDTQISTISSILKDTPRPIGEIKQMLPRHLGRIVNQCLEKDPERRLQSAKDVRNGLEGLKKEIDSGELDQTLTSVTSLGTRPPADPGSITSAPHVAPDISVTGMPTKSRPWLPWAIAGAAVVALASTFWALRPSEPTGTAVTPATPATHAPAPATDDRKMAVVLPFENLGPAEDAYFAAGMTGEITSRLAAVSGLGVISRTSATQYDRTGKTLRQIGDDLGVDFVLEGTVRWAKSADGSGRVRITPQLIRVADDMNLWSETYDRQIDDIFEVQTEIAGHVIDQMGVTLLGSEQQLVEKAPTQSLEAYHYYLQAEELKDPDWGEYDRRYVELMEKATKLDPQFLEAWAVLSQHHSNTYSGPLDKTEERLSSARAALRRAEEIDPEHYRTHLARGSYQYYGFRDYDQALEEFLAAAKIVPNDADARKMVAYIYRRQGKWDEHLENLTAAFELDPQSAGIAANLASTYRALRQFESAMRTLDKAIALNPENNQRVWDKASLMVAWKGDLATAREILGEKPAGNPFWYHLGSCILSLWDRDYSAAMAHAQQLDEAIPLVSVTKTYLISSIEYLDNGAEAARPSLEAARQAIDTALQMAPSNELLRSWRSHNLAFLGHADAAVREAKLTADLVAKDRYSGPAALENLARVYAMVGRSDEAIEILERLSKTVYDGAITPHLLELDAVWDALREDPRFQKLLEQKNI